MTIKKDISRRKFLKRSSQLSLASMAAAQGLGLTGLLNASQAMADTGDYRALVFIMLEGGNDSFNMLLPSGASPLRTNYEQGRGIVSLPNDQLHELNLASPARVYGNTQTNGFAMHPQCGQLAELFNQRDMSMICNVGNLIKPITRQQWRDGTAQVPPRLFSHSDQQRQTQSQPEDPFLFGWGGRMAEMITSHNIDASVSPLISMAGLNSFQVTRDSQINTYVMGNDGAVSLYGFNGSRRQMMEASMQGVNSNSHLMEQKYRDVFDSARQGQLVVGAAFDLAEATGVDYDAVFEAAGATNSNFTRRLKTIAKMIAGRAAISNSRPIYFVELGGFDNHQNLLSDHSQQMAELNAGLKGFRDVLEAQGDFDKTLSYVTSEFARTFTANGEDNEAGTDHGWGGHAMVMGGMINGGQLFGEHPDLLLEGDLDTDRGSWIPTTATTQVSGVIANWMGVAENNLTELFPSLENFSSPFDEVSNLGFIAEGVNS